MNTKHTHAMTLRLAPHMDKLLTDAAYDERLSKAAWVRIAIRRVMGTGGSTGQRRSHRVEQENENDHRFNELENDRRRTRTC